MKDINERTFGLTGIQCRRLVYDYAEANNLEHRLNSESKMAGKDWLHTFMKNCNMTLRTPEATSIRRALGFNPTVVQTFVSFLREIRTSKVYEPHQIFNVDESGLSTVPTRLPKMISPKGVLRVSKIVSAEREKNVTVVWT